MGGGGEKRERKGRGSRKGEGRNEKGRARGGKKRAREKRKGDKRKFLTRKFLTSQVGWYMPVSPALESGHRRIRILRPSVAT